MFGNLSNPVSAYQSVGIDVAVTSADPHKLILLLFDGALAAIAVAKGAMHQHNIAAKGESISKAIDIVENGLKASLDMEQGGDLAEKLAALYDYMVARLLHANLRNDEKALDEVSRLLGEIHGAWAQIRKAALEGSSPAAAA